MRAPFPERLPPANCGQVIEEFAGLIPDPARKLKFLNRVLTKYQKISSIYKLSASFQQTVVTKLAIDELEDLCPGVRKKIKGLILSGRVPAPGGIRWHIYKFRYALLAVVAVALVLGLGSAVASLKRIVRPEISTEQVLSHELSREVITKNVSEVPVDKHRGGGIHAVQPQLAMALPEVREGYVEYGLINNAIDSGEYIEKSIWLVEAGLSSEVYSNGLRIITDYAVENEPRNYYRFFRDSDKLPAQQDRSNEIAGILYHAAESDIIDFKPEKNDSINRYSKALVRYICRHKFYNYFVDRFGRVYRVVREDHAAFHAGWSVWADNELVYLNLNHAFIGICFEGRDFKQPKTEDSQSHMRAMKGSTINEAQLISGKKLTDLLRAKYHISQHNCVTHGLVSINPKTMLIGYHLDLAQGFPFQRFGLKDKTKILLPAITEFGFSYDDYFVKVFDGKLWPGIKYSEEYLRRHAGMSDTALDEYRGQLARRFKRWFEWYKEHQEDKEVS